jgi:hypothetical protein
MKRQVGFETTVSGIQGSVGGGSFPNVAVHLDEQSDQLQGRNLDIYAADLERIEVLEGPPLERSGGRPTRPATFRGPGKARTPRLLGQRTPSVSLIAAGRVMYLAWCYVAGA